MILKIEYLAAKQGKIVIKVNPKHSSQKCRKCGHIDESNRDAEKFICSQCGYMTHADIGAAKTIRDRAFSIVRQSVAGVPPVEGTAEPFRVRGDSSELTRLKHRKEKSARPRGKRAEPGNLSNQDIKAAMS